MTIINNRFFQESGKKNFVGYEIPLTERPGFSQRGGDNDNNK